jgi:hypothetical protein
MGRAPPGEALGRRNGPRDPPLRAETLRRKGRRPRGPHRGDVAPRGRAGPGQSHRPAALSGPVGRGVRLRRLPGARKVGEPRPRPRGPLRPAPLLRGGRDARGACRARPPGRRDPRLGAPVEAPLDRPEALLPGTSRRLPRPRPAVARRHRATRPGVDRLLPRGRALPAIPGERARARRARPLLRGRAPRRAPPLVGVSGPDPGRRAVPAPRGVGRARVRGVPARLLDPRPRRLLPVALRVRSRRPSPLARAGGPARLGLERARRRGAALRGSGGRSASSTGFSPAGSRRSPSGRASPSVSASRPRPRSPSGSSPWGRS